MTLSIHSAYSWFRRPAADTPPAVSGGSQAATTPAAPNEKPAFRKRSKRSTEFVISTFNVLGSKHTAPGGDQPEKASGPKRMRAQVKMLKAHKVDVVGFQEFQPDQQTTFMRLTKNKFGIYPGFKLGQPHNQNSLAWRKDKWKLVKADHIAIPYFRGREIKMPVVRLKNRESGQEAYFINVHNPAHAENEKWRDMATKKEIALIKRLMKNQGLPVFFVGDMNEQHETYEKVTSKAPMVAANARPDGKRPRPGGIDWIFGSKGVEFSDYVKDTRTKDRGLSDHAMIVTKARIEGTKNK